MEITYTDDKGESVEIINHYIEIPSYIKEFDEQKSFLNIKSEDVAMLFHSNKPMSKAVTIGRYQMFLSTMISCSAVKKSLPPIGYLYC